MRAMCKNFFLFRASSNIVVINAKFIVIIIVVSAYVAAFAVAAISGLF